MAPKIHWAIHHSKKQCAVFFAGDERGTVTLPRGWEQIDLRSILQTEEEWEAWLKLPNKFEQLKKLCPPGYEPIETDWARKE